MESKKQNTIDYYNQNSSDFVANTLNVDMTSIYDKFLPLLPKEAKILDMGCGSGRDSLHFQSKGYFIESFDASKALVNECRKRGLNTELATFESYQTNNSFDGIWACASLLHLDQFELQKTLTKFISFLKDDGAFYLSFKYGFGESTRGERFFLDMNEQSLSELAIKSGFATMSMWTTNDMRPGREEKWLNALMKKKSKNSI